MSVTLALEYMPIAQSHCPVLEIFLLYEILPNRLKLHIKLYFDFSAKISICYRMLYFTISRQEAARRIQSIPPRSRHAICNNFCNLCSTQLLAGHVVPVFESLQNFSSVRVRISRYVNSEFPSVTQKILNKKSML
jgi:hypothetical protein